MKITEIAFVCYPVTDLKRARKFYEGTLGLTESRFFGNDEMGMVEYDIGPHTLAIGKGAEQFKPSAGGGAVALEVDDFDEAVKRVRDGGYVFVSEPWDTPVCNAAVISDPDGNTVLIHRRKPAA